MSHFSSDIAAANGMSAIPNRTTLIMKTIEELFFIFVNVFLFKQYLPTKRVHLLYFRERFAHLTEGHLNLIACVLRLTCCAY